MWVGLGHLLECLSAWQDIGAQDVQQVKEVVVAKLNRCCGEQDDGLGVVAEVTHAAVRPGVGVAYVVSLVNDDEIEGGRRIKVEQAALFLAALLISHQQGLVEQGVRQNCTRVLLRPDTIEVCFLDAITQCGTVKMSELFVEALHFL